jgi:hypothetical protein
LSEKISSNNEGLDDFYSLLQTIKRNRDIVGSVFKGMNGIRSTDRFKFVEEDIPKKKEKEKKQKSIKGHIEVPDPQLVVPSVDLQNTKEPEVLNG